MVRLRTAAGNIGWVNVSESDALAMVETGKWVRADSLDYSRTKHGEIRTVAQVADETSPPVKRGPGRPRKQ